MRGNSGPCGSVVDQKEKVAKKCSITVTVGELGGDGPQVSRAASEPSQRDCNGAACLHWAVVGEAAHLRPRTVCGGRTVHSAFCVLHCALRPKSVQWASVRPAQCRLCAAALFAYGLCLAPQWLSGRSQLWPKLFSTCLSKLITFARRAHIPRCSFGIPSARAARSKQAPHGAILLVGLNFN